MSQSSEKIESKLFKNTETKNDDFVFWILTKKILLKQIKSEETNDDMIGIQML